MISPGKVFRRDTDDAHIVTNSIRLKALLSIKMSQWVI